MICDTRDDGAARFDTGFGSRDNKLYYSYVKNVIAIFRLELDDVCMMYCCLLLPCKSFNKSLLSIYLRTMVTPTDAKCAACGKGGVGLKKCTACKLVKYCGVDCQRAHRPQHKRECKRRAAELYDEALFKQPPSREECPICFLELPVKENMQTYKSCCGKIICDGCEIASSVEQNGDAPCPFCRKPQQPDREGRGEETNGEACGVE